MMRRPLFSAAAWRQHVHPEGRQLFSNLNLSDAGLAAYDGALMIVSNDETFLAAVGISRRLQMIPTRNFWTSSSDFS
jgi:uncharacterized protein GlcG (DUF336 family)